jgi:16S rRNA (adenine1518-N6/adenine1519-N6)-dimethyltransferase
MAAPGEYRLYFPMSDLPPLNISQLMRSFGLHTDKRLGQNFLVDDQALRKVVTAAGVGAEDFVLEIGAGLGNLTRYLAVTAHQVVAIEIDGRFIPALRQVMAPFTNVQIVQGDILQQSPAVLFPGLEPSKGYIVAANIPYYITSAVIRHLLEASLRPRVIALTVQREVAERICAGPGDLSLLALSVQVYGKPTIAARIPSGAFMPPPKIDSAVVRIELYPQPLLPEAQLGKFFKLIKAGFSQKRKTLRNALSAGLGLPAAKVGQLLEQANIDPMRRAETLSIEEWGKLVEIFA